MQASWARTRDGRLACCTRASSARLALPSSLRLQQGRASPGFLHINSAGHPRLSPPSTSASPAALALGWRCPPINKGRPWAVPGYTRHRPCPLLTDTLRKQRVTWQAARRPVLVHCPLRIACLLAVRRRGRRPARARPGGSPARARRAPSRCARCRTPAPAARPARADAAQASHTRQPRRLASLALLAVACRRFRAPLGVSEMRN